MDALLQCRLCPRLAGFLDGVRSEYPQYHARPVLPFGDAAARFVVVGLAPGMHGANRTGRPFTGDYAGILLYETLYRHGFSSVAQHLQNDGPNPMLELKGCRITNAVKCLPPDNKPEGVEIRTCNGHLRAEFAELPPQPVILALGTIAHQAVLRALDLKPTAYGFGHGAEHVLPGGQRLVDSYHCSRYNTSTKRLTRAMFDAVVGRCRQLLEE